jgi:hypothetical protein
VTLHPPEMAAGPVLGPEDQSPEEEALSSRRRIAALTTTLGFFAALALSSWSRWNVAVTVLSFVGIVVVPWVWAERPARFRSWFNPKR